MIVALLGVQNRWVVWPDQERREQIKTRIGRVSAFAHCVGFVDGSQLPLDIRPMYQGHSDFYNRKQDYALNCVFVCDDENRVTSMALGWGGSAHDARVYRNTPVSHG